MADETKKQPVRLVRGDLVRAFATEARGSVPAVTGTVRVVNAREVREFYENEFPDLVKKHKNAVSAEAHLFARCIKSWDLLGETGDDPLPITPEVVAELWDATFGQLYGVVTGVAAGDAVLGHSAGTSSS